MDIISSGNHDLDDFLGGGYETDIITTIYGPSGSGKTNLALLCSAAMAKTGKKVVFIDTEGGFSIKRLRQISGDDKEVSDNFLFLRPVSFQEQRNAFEKLKTLVNEQIGLIVVDTIAMLYRLELGKSKKIYEPNRELGKQISLLTEIARKKKIPILITNQVYSGFDKEEIKMVGGDIIKYASKCIIILNKENGSRSLALKKHRSRPEGQTFYFKIVDEGIIQCTH